MRGHRLLLGAAALTAGLCDAAPHVDITVGPCPADIRLVARDAPLSVVLSKLSAALGFKVQYEGSTDPLMTVDVSGKPAALISRLAPDENIVVTEAKDPRCARRARVVRVAVLPKGTPSTLPQTSSPTALPYEPPTAAQRGHGTAADRARLGRP